MRLLAGIPKSSATSLIFCLISILIQPPPDYFLPNLTFFRCAFSSWRRLLTRSVCRVSSCKISSCCAASSGRSSRKAFRKRRVGQRTQCTGIAAESVSQFFLRKRHAEVWGLSRAAIRSCPAERVVPRVVRDEKQLRLSAAAGNSAGLLSDFELSRLPGKAQKHQRLVLRLIHSPVPPSSAPVRPEPPAGSAC